MAENFLFLHVFSGCDTTSSIFNQGKTKFYSLVQKTAGLSATISIFKGQDARPEYIAEAEVRFLVALYGGNMEEEALEEVRYEHFVKFTTKSKFNLASLPPMKDAAQYRAFRTSKNGMGSKKIQNTGAGNVAAMDSLHSQWQRNQYPWKLKFISCTYRKGCGGACGCMKAGLKCSVVYGFLQWSVMQKYTGGSFQQWGQWRRRFINRRTMDSQKHQWWWYLGHQLTRTIKSTNNIIAWLSCHLHLRSCGLGPIGDTYLLYLTVMWKSVYFEFTK